MLTAPEKNPDQNPEPRRAQRPHALEAYLEDEVLALGGPLSLKRARVFLLEASDLIGAPPACAIGPGVRFQWLIGERVIELSPNAGADDEDIGLRFRAFDMGTVPAGTWRTSFKWGGDPADQPYHWYRQISGAPAGVDTWWQPRYVMVASIWEDFDCAFPDIIGSMADDVALTPPAWRDRSPSLTWALGKGSPWETVTFAADENGLDVIAVGHGGRASVRFPRGRWLYGDRRRGSTLTAFVAGLARGGAPALVTDLQMRDVTGMDMCVFTPGPVADIGVLFDGDETNPDDKPITGCTWEEYVRAVERSAVRAPRRRVGTPGRTPLDVRLAPQGAGDLVEALAAALAAGGRFTDVLSRFGAVVATEQNAGESRFVSGRGWSAVIKEHRRGRTVTVEPCRESGPSDRKQRLACARALSTELERRHGAPVARSSGSRGRLTHVFDVGGCGVELSTSPRVELEVGDLRTILATSF